MVAPEARPSEAEAEGVHATPAGYGRPVGASLLGDLVGVKVKSGNVTADITGTLQVHLDRVVNTVYAEVRDQLEAIGDTIVTSAEATWYTQVDRKTGETGKVDDELRLTTDKLSVVVLPEATKRTYVVRRPGANSTLRKLATKAEYSAAMSQYRRTGQLPEQWTRDGTRFSEGRPSFLQRRIPNPKASDGKLLWQELVIKPGKALGAKLKREGSDAIRAAVKRSGG